MNDPAIDHSPEVVREFVARCWRLIRTQGIFDVRGGYVSFSVGSLYIDAAPCTRLHLPLDPSIRGQIKKENWTLGVYWDNTTLYESGLVYEDGLPRAHQPDIIAKSLLTLRNAMVLDDLVNVTNA